MKRVEALRRETEQWQTAHNLRHDLEQLAIGKAEDSVNQRLEGMNELRAQIATERGNYVLRETFDKEFKAMDERMKLLEKGSSFDAGRIAMLGAVIIFALGMLGVVIHFWK